MKHLLPHKYLLEKEETYEPPEDPDSSKWILSFELQIQNRREVHCDILETCKFPGGAVYVGETGTHHALPFLIASTSTPCPIPQSTSGMNGIY